MWMKNSQKLETAQIVEKSIDRYWKMKIAVDT